MRRRTFLQAAVIPLAAPAVAQPAKATTLRIVPQSNLTVLDPIWTTATVTGNHGYHVFDTLYSADSGLRPKPQMAAGHEVSADQRVWRIRLREGLRFHDNTPVRSIDCALSLQRWCKRDGLGQLLDAAVETWATPDDRTHGAATEEAVSAAAGRSPSRTPRCRSSCRNAWRHRPDETGHRDGGFRAVSFPARRFRLGQPRRLWKFDAYVPRSGRPTGPPGRRSPTSRASNGT